jgi:hypothetical protein
MDAVAVEHAIKKLQKAEKSLEIFKAATNYEAAEGVISS